MPLDFSKDIPPPTLGKRVRTAPAYVVDDTEVGLTRDDVTMGLRTVGGTMKVRATEYDVERQKRYADHYASQEARESREKEGSETPSGMSGVPAPPKDKVSEYVNYYAMGATGTTPGWLPQDYRPFTQPQARDAARKLMSGAYRTDNERERRLHFSPRIEIMGGVSSLVTSPTIVVTGRRYGRHGPVHRALPKAYFRVPMETIRMANARDLTEFLFKDINTLIVAVGMEEKRIEREERRAASGPVTAHPFA